MARLDAAGYICLAERMKFRIKSGGYNIFPTEIESVLAEHPAVNEVAVIGLPDPRWGESIHAVRSVASELGDAIRDATESAGPEPAARLHALIHASFTPPGFTPDKVAVWVSLAGTARWSPGLGEIYRAIWRDYRAGVGRLLARAAKVAGVALDTERTALTFSQLVEGLWIGWAADPEAVTQEAAEACFHRYLDLVLGARI